MARDAAREWREHLETVVVLRDEHQRMRVIQHQLRGGLGVTIHVEPARGPAHVAELPRAVPEEDGADRGIVPAGLRVHRVRVPYQ